MSKQPQSSADEIVEIGSSTCKAELQLVCQQASCSCHQLRWYESDILFHCTSLLSGTFASLQFRRPELLEDGRQMTYLEPNSKSMIPPAESLSEVRGRTVLIESRCKLSTRVSWPCAAFACASQGNRVHAEFNDMNFLVSVTDICMLHTAILLDHTAWHETTSNKIAFASPHQPQSQKAACSRIHLS